MLAVIPVRDGLLPPGSLDVIAECGGRGLFLTTDGTVDEAELAGVAVVGRTVDAGPFGPARWSELAARAELDDVIVLPATVDGRDLAPRLAAQLRRPMLAEAMTVTEHSATLIRGGGLELHDVAIDGPVVVTMHPGVRSVIPDPEATVHLEPEPIDEAAPGPGVDPAPLGIDEADLATMDLAEASRIVGAGAGLDGPARLPQLAALGAAIGAVVGATRVVTDRGWLGHDRQIGTTGVVVDPALYLAFGISGAVQHTSGLGTPDHVVSVNTDPHCPMMQLADLAVVADANAVLDELTALLARGAPLPGDHDA